MLFRDEKEYPVTKTVTLTNTADEPVHIKSVNARQPTLDVSWDTLEDGKKYEINVTLSEEPEDRTLRDNIRIVTDRKRSPVVNVRVMAPVHRRPGPPGGPARPHSRQPVPEDGATKE